jgi:uncharacterized protein YjiS (DUF1127 family)
MPASITTNQFAFQLPTLSYVDASLEEPNLRIQSAPASKGRGIAEWLAARVSAFIAWRQNAVARFELSRMTDHELMDIGLNRGDVDRAFMPGYNEDLLDRNARA